MEEVKEAIIGHPGLYCNGIRQFTGYVSDLGALPSLYYVDENGDMKELPADDNLSEILKKCKLPPQPRELWTRDIDRDGKLEIPDGLLWKYHKDGGIWAGWRGPYIEPPPDGVLRDKWGNPLVFLVGELVTRNRNTYRCIKSHEETYDDPKPPEGGSDYWQPLSQPISAREWIDLSEMSFPNKKDRFYEDALTVVSYGENGRPGGKGLDKDLVIAVYKQEYTGEVAGHVGYHADEKKIYTDKVTIYYPQRHRGEDLIKSKTIDIKDIDHGYGINFRFGDSPTFQHELDENDRKVAIDDPNSVSLAIPLGIRAIATAGKTYIFPVEPTGNWVGTLK